MITFVPTTLSIKSVQDGQSVEHEVEAMVAEAIGLAYVQQAQSQAGEPFITLTHVPTGTQLSDIWYALSERHARRWIEKLDEVIDWTRDIPEIRTGKYARMLHLATIGVLYEVEGEED